jgi:hypothetical protein
MNGGKTSALIEISHLIYIIDDGYWSYAFPSVLLPLVPADNYQAHVLLCGKTPSQLLDFGKQNLGWQTVPRDSVMENVFRRNACATLLPTGQVLLTGGAHEFGGNPNTNYDQISTGAKPEIYHTPLDAVNKTYAPGVGSWETLNDPATLLRNYHSTALLMPDGRVWTAGGNGPNQPGDPNDPKKPSGDPDPAVQQQLQIYQPPYPAGTRPTISKCPKSAAYRQQFDIIVPSAGNIQNVVLMRCGCSTHAFNVDQRSVWLNFEHTASDTLTATAPPNGNVAPPGYYMLFVVDTMGCPCDYAKFVRLGGSVSMFTGRNKVSEHEVQALLTTTPPTSIPSVFYVVLDGFCAKDLSNGDRPFPPVVQFHFVDDNSTVPGLTASLQNTLYKSTTATPDITQRITLEFQCNFANADAFNGIAVGDQRQIRIDVAWGSSHTNANMVIFKKEHVYAFKGSTPWLSIDVRVLRLPRGKVFGTQTNNNPEDFIQKSITDFRTNQIPGFNAFDQLSTDEYTNFLELASKVGGVEVDNFVFAKVRYRAPKGIQAKDVKVFFCIFATSLTNMVYDKNSIYSRIGDGKNAVATPGSVGGQVASMPFFADARNSDITKNLDLHNVQTLTGNDAAEVVTYFGCWLDFNQNIDIRNAIIKSGHQCIVAEIH